MFKNASEASQVVATEIATLVRERASAGKPCVLGLATGSTPMGVYRELIRMHRDENLSLRNVVTFNLDEYFPMAPDAAQSYVRFMNENLFDHVDVLSENVHIPDGTIAEESVGKFCDDYESKIAAAGGIDLQLLGIGRTGHIGFNEPRSDADTVTRMVVLNSVTRNDAAENFDGLENVPHHAVTMGVQTILNAQRIRLMAYGEHKSAIVERTVCGDITESIPATFLQQHGDVRFLMDDAAASKLNLSNTSK
ncbi:Glucosamine-6-phosphate deaminase 1 [Rubripirellula obstinata]|uniref:Glucosamine-6-phosphate deaminase n=1 Tax=Rubripirellula obstinata TaxID=406547 RepID=A0A5B1CAY9_9BACT|nr:Glucosamine-6-phosphate deaminase 1 [Rubripirellula obstinata]